MKLPLRVSVRIERGHKGVMIDMKATDADGIEVDVEAIDSTPVT